MEQKGVVYARSMYNIQHKVTPDSIGQLNVSLECERPDMEIRYTVDEAEPTATSTLYTQPIVVTANTTVKAATFKGGKQMGKTLLLPIAWNKATAKPLLKASPDMKVLVNGLRGSSRQTDFEWFTGVMNKPVTFVVDLQKNETLKKFTAGCITNYGMAVHKPRSMKVEVSTDNRTFTEVGTCKFTDQEIYKEGTFIDNITVNSNGVEARYVKFTFEPSGNCPKEHNRPGQVSRFYLDEISIE